MKPALILWRFSPAHGRTEVDMMLVGDQLKQPQAITYAMMRARFAEVFVAGLRVPDEVTPDELTKYVESNTEDVIKKLKSAEFDFARGFKDERRRPIRTKPEEKSKSFVDLLKEI